MIRIRQRSLLHHHDVAMVWWAGLVSGIGNYAMFVAVPVMIYQRTSSPWATALVVLAGALPPVLVGQVAGVLADKLDRRRILIWANLATAVLTCGYVAIGQGSWWAFAVAGLLISSVAQLLGPAEHALLPEVVPLNRLGEAASLNALNNNLARLLGPAVGGLLLAQFSFSVVAVIDATTFAVAALLAARISTKRPLTPTPDARGQTTMQLWRAGAAVILAHPRLRTLVPLLALVMFGEGFISALFAPFVHDVLGGSAETIGWILSAQAIGGILGAWWASRMADHIDPFTLLGFSALASGALLVVIFNYSYVYAAIWPSIALTAVAGVPFAIFGTAQTLALQTWSPARSRGRVFAFAMGAMSLLQLAGITVAGILGERWGASVINADAAAYLLAAVAALWLVRHSRSNSDCR